MERPWGDDEVLWLEEHDQYSMWVRDTGEDALSEGVPNEPNWGASRTALTNLQHHHLRGEGASYRGAQRHTGYRQQRRNRVVAGPGTPGSNIAGASKAGGGITGGGIIRMRRILLRVHQGLAWVVLVGLLLQFYWVGMALFGATSFELHRIGDICWLYPSCSFWS